MFRTRTSQLGLLLALMATTAFGQDGEQPSPSKQPARAESPASTGGEMRAEMEIEKGGQPLGVIVIQLEPERAPITVQNFVRYADEGFYNGTIFHRVIANFMIQGGGYTSDMTEKKAGLHPPIKNEWRNGLKNVRGSISMARVGGNPDSATAQFFINVVDNGRLDQPQPDGAAYAVFGKVVNGMEVVDAIRNTEVTEHPNLPMGKVVPAAPIVIKSVKVTGDRSKIEAAMKAARAAEERLMQDAIAAVESQVGGKVTMMESGIAYYIVEASPDGDQPKPTDTVTVHYTLTLPDGTKVESSRDTNQPATFPLQGLIQAWKETIPQMKVGEKRKIIVPPSMGYGSRPGHRFEKNVLIFDIELLGIQN